MILQIVLLLHIYCAAAVVGESITSSSSDYTVGTVVNLTCPFENSTAEYLWASDCLDNLCFSAFSDQSRTVSTLDRPKVQALTSVDNGNYTCTVSDKSSTVLEIKVQGIGVFDEQTQSPVQNNSYFVADQDGDLNIALHCIGAKGSGSWLYPNGSEVDSSPFEVIYEQYGSTVLLQSIEMNQTVVDNDTMAVSGSGDMEEVDEEGGSGYARLAEDIDAGVIAFNDSSLEGYYRCKAADENGEIMSINVGLFLYGRAAPGVGYLEVSNNPVLIGSTITFNLNSTVVGYPLPTFEWYLNGTFLEETIGPSLVVNIINLSDYGNYSCIVSNIVGQASSNSIILEQALSPVVTTTSGSLTTVIEPLPYNVSCSATGYPLPNITMDFNQGTRYVFTDDQTIFITRVVSRSDSSHSGTYTCTAENSFGVVNETFTISVQVAPNVFTDKDEYIVPANSTLVITCNATGIPQPDLSFESDISLTEGTEKIVIGPGATDGSQTLTIKQIDTSYTGLYRCIANNSVDTAQKAFNITVQYIPIVTAEPANMTVIYKQQNTVEINCSFTGEPIPTVTWFNQMMDRINSSSSSDDKYNILTTAVGNDGVVASTLVVRNIVPNDDGVYTCTGSNTLGSSSSSAVITVNAFPEVFTDNDSYVGVDNGSVTVACRATGVPVPLITWYQIISSDDPNMIDETLNDAVVFNTSYAIKLPNGLYEITETMTISPLNMTYSSEYYCEAYNDLGNSRKNFNITVQYKPIDEGDLTDVTLVHGRQENASFTCVFMGDPRPMVSWLYNTTQLMASNKYSIITEQLDEFITTSTLTVLNVQPTDTGVYYCNGSNFIGYTILNASLTVHVQSRDIVISDDLIVVQPESIELMCTCTGIPTPDISWYSYSTLLITEQYDITETKLSNNVTQSILRIGNSSPFNTSNYTCNASNIAGYITDTVQVIVHVEPSVVVNAPLQLVNEFSNVSITCSSTGIPIPSITWIRNGTVITDNERITVTNSASSLLATRLMEYKETVIISNIMDTDNGTYSCQVSNDAGSANTSFDIVVNYGTRLITGINNQTIIEYSDFSMSCLVEGRPHPSIRWWFSSTDSPEDFVELVNDDVVMVEADSINGLTVESVIVFKNVTRRYHGVYKCNSSNDLIPVESIAFITINFNTAITSRPVSQTIVSPGSAVFQCVGEGRPRPTIDWYKDDSLISMNDQKYTISRTNIYSTTVNSTLTVNSTVPLDKGAYTCAARNVLANDTASAQLTIHVVPDILSPSADQQFIVNQSDPLSITCNATAIPDPQLFWYKDGSDLVSSDLLNPSMVEDYVTSSGTVRLTEQLLTIEAADSTTDSGEYSCTASNTAGNDTVDFSIFVQVPPRVTAVDGDRHIISIVNSMTIIEFTIDQAIPDVTPEGVQWIFSEKFTDGPYDDSNIDITGEKAPPTYHYSDNNRQLNISNVSQADEGRYFLIATNPAGVNLSHIDIIVHGPPKIIKPPSDSTIVNGNNVTFICEGVADPLHDVTWFFNNLPIASTVNDDVDSLKYLLNKNNMDNENYGTLTVVDVQYNDEGTYVCALNNTVDTVSASVSLSVHVIPVIHEISESVSVNISEPLILYCVAIGFPPPDFTWIRNNEVIDNTEGISMMRVPYQTVPQELGLSHLNNIPFISLIGFVGLLEFSAVVRSDTSNYTCNVSNLVTQDTSDVISITVLERPDPPTDINVNVVSSRSIMLSWKPTFDGNRDIMGYQVLKKEYGDVSFERIKSSDEEKYTTTAQNYTVTGLEPYTKYEFKVLACNIIGCTSDDIAIATDPIRTDTDKPETPPQDCSAVADSSTSLSITWAHPEKPNGLIVAYEILYRPVNSTFSEYCTVDSTVESSTTTASNDTALVLTGLSKGTRYSLRIIAYTSVGPSEPSSDDCSRGTAYDEPETTPIINSIVSPSSTSLTVKWELPTVDNIPCEWNGPIVGYRLKYAAGQSEQIINISKPNSVEETYTIPNLQIFTEYTVSVSVGTEIGYGEFSIAKTVRTLNDTPSEPLNVRTELIGERNIKIRWDQPRDLNGIITDYRIYYTGSKEDYNGEGFIDSEQNVNTGSDEQEYLLSDLDGHTTYSILIAAINGAGEGTRSTPVENTTERDAPPNAPAPSPGMEVPNRRQFQILLEEPSSINGPISHYQVIVVYLPEGELPPNSPDEQFPSIDSFNTYEYVSEYNGMEDPVAYIAAEFGSDLFPVDSMYIIGDEDEPNDRRANYTNGPLNYGSEYTFFLRAYPEIPDDDGQAKSVKRQTASRRQYTKFSSSGYYPDVYMTGRAPADNSGVVAGVVTVLLVLLLIAAIVIVVLLIIIYRRKTSSTLEFGNSPIRKDRSDVTSITSDFSLTTIPSFKNPTYSDESDTDGNQLSGHPPIPVGEFGKIVDRLHANDNFMFSQEYDEICAKSPQPPVDVCLNPVNKCRNRYANIQAYDHSRVKLIPVDGHPHDYINANFLDGYNRENEYIATQGPLPDTVGDFWRMVWDHNVLTVVMLTNLVEKMRVKCTQYWPDGVGLTEQYANIRVNLTKIVTHADYCIRTFEIQAEDSKEIRNVKQFHFLSWPDFGVPRHSTPLLQFLRVVRRNHKYTDTRPLIVHCSAGVGRTGTFCAIDSEMQKAKHEGILNPYMYVRSMRNNRNHMVQTEAQYIFLHDALLDVITTGWADIGVEQLADRIAELEEEDDQGETGYLNEFNRLKSAQQFISEYGSAMNDANKFKNRILNALPYDHNRVKLSVRPGEPGSDYVNASFIDGYKTKNVFIATQGPMENTQEDFWRMVWEQESSIIVMLCNTEERGQPMCCRYFPSHVGGSLNIEQYYITCTQELIMEDYTRREFKLLYASSDDKRSRIVHHYQYKTWPRSGAPASGEGLLDLMDQVVRSQQQTGGDKPVIVHCSAGVGRTGTFCTLFIAIERAKVEQVINIFDTVKHLRTQRAHMVQTQEQYIFCYRAMLEYVESLNTYANFQTSI